MLTHLVDTADSPVPIFAVTPASLDAWMQRQPASTRAWVERSGFKAKPARHLTLPDARGGLGSVLLGVEEGVDIWSFGALPGALPEGSYRVAEAGAPEVATAAALGWALGGYAFTRYKKPEREFARLVWPKAADRAHVERAAAAIFLVRDLVNTPAGDMGPAELAEAARAVARRHRAKFKITIGEDLLAANYPAIYAVGKGSSRAPRLVDIRWGDRGPLVALVGKGVCFDSGGLDMKPSSAMLLMKKDMGGAAHVLALAQMIMEAGLPLRLRLLIPAVENSVSGDSFHPLDVLQTRKGITVEVGNTDAEGRLVLCDALADADSEKPDLVVDCATLTGAARVALGPELPALFSNNDGAADALLRHAQVQQDPLWRMPLHKSYRTMLDSKVADINNVSSGAFAGAITAALFLQEFVSPETPWLHLDLYAWNPTTRPGRPEGGEAMTIRALYALIAERAAANDGTDWAISPRRPRGRTPARASRGTAGGSPQPARRSKRA